MRPAAGGCSIASAMRPIAINCCWPGRGRAAVHDADYWRGLASLPQRWQAPKFPLKAADFIARGIAEGPALGHVLAQAEEVWLAADLPMQQAEISAIADQTVTRFARDDRL